MKYAKKMMLVPYVPPTTPEETKLGELDNQMSGIIKNKSFTDDEKIKLYNQALNKFIQLYNPKTSGLAPALVELIAKLKTYIDKENKKAIPMVTQNTDFVVTPNSSSTTISTPSSSKMGVLPSASKTGVTPSVSTTTTQKDDQDEDLVFTGSEQEQANNENELASLLSVLEPLQTRSLTNLTPEDPFKTFSKIGRSPSGIPEGFRDVYKNQLELDDFDDAYYRQNAASIPANNTRSKITRATHEEGIQSSHQLKTINKSENKPATKIPTKPATNKSATNKSATDNGKTKSKQSGSGIWLRKRFF